MPALRSRSSAFGPTPGSRRTASGARKAASRPGGTTTRPPGLRASLATLATTLHDAGREEIARDLADVEVALVHSRLLDRRHDAAHRFPDVLRVLAVERVARADEDGRGATAERLGCAHGGVNPEAARDVVGRSDDAAPARVAADDERLRPEVGVLELLDGRVERVEIEMRDDHANKCTGRR